MCTTLCYCIQEATQPLVFHTGSYSSCLGSLTYLYKKWYCCPMFLVRYWHDKLTNIPRYVEKNQIYKCPLSVCLSVSQLHISQPIDYITFHLYFFHCTTLSYHLFTQLSEYFAFNKSLNLGYLVPWQKKRLIFFTVYHHKRIWTQKLRKKYNLTPQDRSRIFCKYLAYGVNLVMWWTPLQYVFKCV